MGKIGSYDYPDFQFGTLLEAIKVLVEKFGGQVNDENTFAEAIGHTSHKSGTFITKMGALRKYGLVEKRGVIATERAKKIINYLSVEEKQRELNGAITEIKLWKDLFQRTHNKRPSWDDFKIHLVEITGDRDTSISEGPKIHSLYIDAMNYLTELQSSETPPVSLVSVSAKKEAAEQSDVAFSVPDSIITLKSGEINVSLPKNDDNISILINILEAMKKKKEKVDLI